MSIKKRNLSSRIIGNKQLDVDAPKNRFIFEDFRGPFTIAKQAGGAATGAAGDRNILAFGHTRLEQFVLGATQAIFNPPLVAGGLDIAGSQIAAHGFEYSGGIEVRQEAVFTIGSEGPFFVEAELKPDDASGAALLVAGFRKVQAYQAAWADYTDKASVGASGTANPNTIQTVTALNNAADVETLTGQTWADAATKKLKVRVLGSGRVEFYVNGVRVNPHLVFAFDVGDQVVPFVRFAHAADLAGAVAWSKFCCGAEKE